MKASKDENATEKPYRYVEQTVTRRIHHYYISQGIEEPIHYAEMVFQIQTAGPDDIIHLHLNMPGGYLTTGVQLVNAMQASPAHVVSSLEGEVASLGTMLFLAADEFIVHDNAILMFHNYSGGVVGKGHEQIAALEATTKWTDDLMRRLYVPFMTPEEVECLKKGEDKYIHAEEIRDRLINMVEILEQQKKDEEKAQEQTERKVTKKKVVKKKVAKKKVTPKKAT